MTILAQLHQADIINDPGKLIAHFIMKVPGYLLSQMFLFLVSYPFNLYRLSCPSSDLQKRN